MKNLKKVLALVLVVATLMSFATVASAKFTDANSIDKSEAVDVMSVLGVIKGYTDGSFKPEGDVTRAEMAKMVTMMISGGEDVGDLYTGANVFSDCTSHWAKGYIAYANKMGIVAGVGGGKFNPDGSVTGTQAAKMMLVALGYRADVEGYTGSQWSVNVLADARDAGLLKGLDDVNMASNLSRENAAQMMLNTLEATLVKYEGGTNITTGDGTSIVVDAKREEVQRGALGDYTTDNTTDGKETTAQFCEKYFSDLTKGTVNTSDDAFGRPSYSWTYKTNSVVANSTPDVVFTAKTDADDVAKALKGYSFKNGTTEYKINNDSASTYTNTWFTSNDATGKIMTTVSASGKTTSAVASDNAAIGGGACTVANRVSRMTGNGTLVEFYADDQNVITNIIIVDTSIAEVTKVSTNKDGDVTYTVSGTGYTDYADEDKTDKVVVSGDVQKGDYVTYVVVSGVAYLYDTTSVQGVQTRKDQDNKITVDGTVYSLQKNAVPDDFNNSTETFNYYIDQYGYVVATTSTAVDSANYAMVLDMYLSVNTTIDGTTPTVEARVMLSDGTVGTYDVALEEIKTAGDGLDVGDWAIKGIKSSAGNKVMAYDKSGQQTTASLNTWYDNNLENKAVYGYTLKDNVITFESKGTFTGAAEDDVITAAVTGVAKNTINYTSGSNTVVANQNTKFVVYNADKKSATVYTGSNALPTFPAGNDNGVAVATVTATTTKANASYIFVSTATGVDSADTDEYVYIDVTKFVESGSGDDKVYEYTGTYADGTTVTLTTDTQLTGGNTSGLYEVKENNEVGDKITVGGAQFLAAADLTLDNGILSVEGGNSYYVTDDTQIVYIDDDQTEVDGSNGLVVLEMKDGAPTQNVAAIFVIGSAT